MKTENFLHLIREITGRPLELASVSGEPLEGEIPLDCKLTVRRENCRFGFTWKTPKNEESLARSFVSCYLRSYKEPDPEKHATRIVEGVKDLETCGNSWTAEERQGRIADFRGYREVEVSDWKNPEKRENHRWWRLPCCLLSPEQLKEQLISRLSEKGNEISRLSFYPTNYGIGIFVIFGGRYISEECEKMRETLKSRAITFRNEFSEAAWVLRFVIGIDKPTHAAILQSI